jgi:hypothetical protein
VTQYKTVENSSNMVSLEAELVLSTLKNTLTEQRYNEILDMLLPNISQSPDATAQLKSFGKLEWRQRRSERLKASTAA